MTRLVNDVDVETLMSKRGDAVVEVTLELNPVGVFLPQKERGEL